MSSLLCANTSFAHAVSGVSSIIIPHTITALREFSFPNSNLPPGAYMEQMDVLYLHLLKQYNFNHKKTNANNNNNSNMVQYCQSLKIKDGCNHTNAFFPISSIEVTDDTLPTADVLLFLLLLIEQETRFLFFSHNNNNNSILSPLKQKYLFGLIWNVLRFLAKNKNDSRTVQLESLTAIECNLLCTFVVETIVQKMSNNNNKSTADSNDNNKTVWTEVEMLLNSILFEKKETETECDRPDENTVKFFTINLVQFYSVITFTSLSLLTLKHIVQPTLLINLSRKSGIDQNVEKFTYSFLNSTVASVLKGLEDDDRHSEEAKNSPANEDEQKEEPTAQEEPTVHVDPNDGVSEEKENSSEAEVPPPQAFHYAPSPSDENRGKEEQAEATSEVKEDEHRDEEEAELPDAEATSDNNEKLDNEKEEEPADVEAATNENENEEPLETANESAIPPITGTFAIPARRLSSLLLQHLLISWVATAPDEEEQAEEEDTDKTGAVRARLQQAQKEYEDCFTRENETNDRDNDKSALWGRFGFLLLELFQMIL
ncbi:hypothetical protein, conserved [Angomonas deanei]|uniref:Uncharacterized protein n=1 Tax=Angomonas deanei TaxID=59799 RepID=A0A7G2CX11_9TRYP|nr:hypothetical protein, conserved [Angomonas deanei]